MLFQVLGVSSAGYLRPSQSCGASAAAHTAEPVIFLQGHDQVKHPPKGLLAPQPAPLNPHHSNNTRVSSTLLSIVSSVFMQLSIPDLYKLMPCFL